MNTIKTLLLTSLITCSSALMAQTRTVTLMIDHSIGDSNYQDLRHFETWDGKAAYLDNLFYYIHDVQIVTGQGDTVGELGKHILVDAAAKLDYELGTFDADSATKVLFNWGVAADVNHADPSQYAAGHPLGHQNPTMHWGWSAGYRFIRADGRIDDNNDGDPTLPFQYHMVGDQFVGPVITNCVSMLNDDDELEVWVTAHYERLFDQVDVVNNALIHGSSFPMSTIFGNVKFAPVFDTFDGRAAEDTTDTATGITFIEQQLTFNLWPNPTVGGEVKLMFSESTNNSGTIEAYDMTGKAAFRKQFFSTRGAVTLPELTPGLYLIRVSSVDGQLDQVSRLIVQ